MSADRQSHDLLREGLLDTVYKKSYARAGLLTITPVKIKCLPVARFIMKTENESTEEKDEECRGSRLALTISGADGFGGSDGRKEVWSEDPLVGKL